MPRPAAAAATTPPPARTLLLATAHPDDEALFFVPALLSVGSGKGPLGGLVGVDVVCLSTGNAAGLGAVRAKELRAAVPALLGHRAGSVTVVDHPGLQDGMHTAWDVEAATDAISTALSNKPSTAALLSFDRGGVTRHANHAATATALAVVAAAVRPGGVTAWRLRSLPWYLAWLGPVAVFVVPLLAAGRGKGVRAATSPLPPVAILTAVTGPAAVLRGLAVHASQRTWWRVLGAVVRSASYVSVLEEVVL